MLLLDTLFAAQDTLDSIMAVVPEPVVVDSIILSRQAVEAIKDGPSEADLVQARAAIVGAVTAVLGTLFALVTLLKLVGRNKEHEAHIAQLSSIASSQEEQIRILSNQVNELKNHTFLMQSTLNIYEGILENSTQDITMKKAEAETKRLELKEKQRLEIQPSFNLHTTEMLALDIYSIYLFNGSNSPALNLKITDLSAPPFLEWYVYYRGKDAEVASKVSLGEADLFNVLEEKAFKMDGHAQRDKTESNANSIPFSLLIEYRDSLNNCYTQKVIKPSSKEKVYVDKPVLIEAEIH